VIACIEATLMTRRAPIEDQLAAIRAIRARLHEAVFDHEAIDGFKRQGRS
jgi:hypothetical protein